MKFKKYFLILALFMVMMCCVSAISAASDDAIDNLETGIDTDDAVSVGNDDLVGADSDTPELNAEEGDANLGSVEDDSELGVDESNEKLSVTPPSYMDCSVKLDNTLINSHDTSVFYCHIKPATGSIAYGYDFTFYVIDKNSQVVYSYHYQSTSKTEKDYRITIAKDTLLPGTYVMTAINTYDGVELSAAYLFVSGTAIFTVNDFSGRYMSNTRMTARVTDSVSGKPLNKLVVKVVFTKGKTTKTMYYTTNANGEISFVPPLSVGTWSVSFSSAEPQVSGSVVKKAVVSKSSVWIRAYNVLEYRGYKTPLKVVVKSQGKNVNEGKVQFRINGRTYQAPVKNGVAKLNVYLRKVGNYRYSAIYLGSGNLYKSKVSRATAFLRNRVPVKLIFPNPVVYMGKTKRIVVKVVANGRYVKEGWLKVRHKNGVDTIKITNGKVVLYAVGLVSDHYKGSNGYSYYYKKTFSHRYWMVYAPASHKYMYSKKIYTATSKYRCPDCGKTTTHYHRVHDWFYSYNVKIVVT